MKPLAARRPPPRLDVRDLYALPLARTQARDAPINDRRGGTSPA
jgi:hypothetical protein